MASNNGAGGRGGVHQLSNGLYVSAQPDRQKDKACMMSVPQMPYTGGDVKKSGELGKMLNIPVTDAGGAKRKSGSLATPAARAISGPLKSASGPLTSSGAPWIPGKSAGTISVGTTAAVSGGAAAAAAASSTVSTRSGELRRATSGPLQASNSLKTSGPQPTSLPTTGLITSGPITASGPLSAPPRKAVSGPIGDSGRPTGAALAINCVSGGQSYSFLRNFPRMILYTLIPLFVIGFIAGAFIFAAVKNAVLLFVVAALFGLVLVVMVWNTVYGRRAVFGFLAKHPLSDLNAAKDGQLVKVTGVVTCGSVPLESSYQRVSRCVYTSTGLYEYRNYASKKARENHRRYTWGLRHTERYVVDFYISDFQTGLRALVKAGYGARVTPHVTESTIVDLLPTQKDIPTDFLRWLTERNLSADDRVMRLKEGYVKEGSTVTVMGVVQRHENILMLVPPPEPMSTGCQWSKFLLPATLEGIILKSEEPSKVDGVPV